jgi:hypothetical protein
MFNPQGRVDPSMNLKNPLVWFFLVAFGMPWLGWSSIHFFGMTEPSPLRTALFYTGDFCSVAGLVAMFVQSGKAGVIDMLKRCVRINVSPLWWLIVLVVPFLISFLGYLVVGSLGTGIGTITMSGFAVYLAPAVLMNFTTGPWAGNAQRHCCEPDRGVPLGHMALAALY